MIKTYDYITCECCGGKIEVGENAYDYMNTTICEACFDKAVEQMKADAEIEVNADNFDLEEEY